jgi:hypothetical protein
MRRKPIIHKAGPAEIQNNWNGEMPVGGQAKQIALCLNANGCLEMFYIGTGGDLYQSTQTGQNNVLYTKAKHFSKDSAKQILLVQDGNGQLNLFYISTSGHIFQNIQTDAVNNFWTGDNPLPGTGSAAQVAVVRDSKNLLNIFWIGPKKMIFHMRQQAVGSPEWVDLVEFWGEPALEVTALSNNHSVHIIFIAKDGSVWRKNQSDLTLDQWNNNSVPFNIKATQLSAALDNLGFAHIFYVGAKDQLFHDWQTDVATDQWNGQVNGQTPFGDDKGVEIISTTSFFGLQLFFRAKDNGLHSNFEHDQTVNLLANANWNGSVPMHSPRGTSYLPKAKQMATAANIDGHLEIFFVGDNDDIYRDWQITNPPDGTLGSNINNVLFPREQQALTGVSVTIEITEAVQAYADSGSYKGFEFQLNCNSLPNFKCVWQQYIIGIAGKNLVGKVNNWPDSNQWIINHNFNLVNDLPNQAIPVGYKLIITLENDPDGNVHYAAYGVVDQFGNTVAYSKQNIKSLASGHTKNIAPIADMTVNLVGPDNGEEVILSSGAGVISYVCDQPLMSKVDTGETAESGNSSYTAVLPIPGTSLSQRFSVILNEETVLASPSFD